MDDNIKTGLNEGMRVDVIDFRLFSLAVTNFEI
jgi:hypothetical protein